MIRLQTHKFDKYIIMEFLAAMGWNQGYAAEKL